MKITYKNWFIGFCDRCWKPIKQQRGTCWFFLCEKCLDKKIKELSGINK